MPKAYCGSDVLSYYYENGNGGARYRSTHPTIWDYKKYYFHISHPVGARMGRGLLPRIYHKKRGHITHAVIGYLENYG
jgi:hypothetical protein